MYSRFLTNAVLPVRSDLKASIADTLEASLCVDTASIAAHYSIHDALVNVYGEGKGQS